MITNKIILNLFLIFLIFNNNKLFVKSDITDTDELTSLWWLATQYYLGWDLSTNICNNIGITCNSAKNSVIKLVIDNTIPLGIVTPPTGLTTSGISTTTTTTPTPTPTPTTTDTTTSTYTTTGDYTTSYSTTNDYTSTTPNPTTTTYTTTVDYTTSTPTPTSYTSTGAYTTLTPTPSQTLATDAPALKDDFLVGGRSLLSTPRNTATVPEIELLVFSNIQSIIISKATDTGINILGFIGLLENLVSLEVSNASDIKSLPTPNTKEGQFLYYCRNLSYIKLSNLPITNITEDFFNQGNPFDTVIIDFPVEIFPWSIYQSAFGIKNLYLNYNGTLDVRISGYDWQYLSNFTLKTTKTFTFGNFSSLRTVSIDCQNNLVNPFNFTDNNNLNTVTLNNCNLTGFEFYNTDLLNLNLYGGNIQGGLNAMSLPINLESLYMEYTGSKYLPVATQTPNLKYLVAPNNNIWLPFTQFENLLKLNTSRNVMVGNIPSTFCSIPSIDLSHNKFSSPLPNCFLCHWTLTQNWFFNNSNSLAPSGFTCDAASQQTNFDVLSVGETLGFNCTNCGWAINAETGLAAVVPNNYFTFAFPKKSLGLLSKTIQFSSDLSIPFTWTYYDLTIGKVTFTQNPTFVNVEINGLFDASSKILLDGVQYVPVSRNHTVIILNLDTSFVEGQINITIQSTLTQTSKLSIYKRDFPVISSASIVPKSGGDVTLYGNFYYNDTTTNTTNPPILIPIVNSINSISQLTNQQTQDLKVIVNGQDCSISSSNATTVVFNAPNLSQGGYANIQVINLSYNFTSSKILYYQVINNECQDPCQNDGTCVAGQCKCIGDYYGPTCSLKKAPTNTYTLKADDTQPSATYSFEKVDFEFSLKSVQEIGIDGNVVQQINITDWDAQNIQFENIGDATQYTSKQSIGNSSINVIVAIIQKQTEYQFADVSMDLEPQQVKVSMNISDWEFMSSLNTLRAVFISTSKSTSASTNDCESNDQEVNSQSDGGDGLLSFTIKRSGAILFGQFIDRMLSNTKITHSNVQDLGLINGISYVGINMPNCKECILDPNFSVLVDPGYSNGGCNNSKKWVIPVAVVIPVLFVVTLSVVAYIYAKKHFYFSRDGRTFKFTRRGKRSSKYDLDTFSK